MSFELAALLLIQNGDTPERLCQEFRETGFMRTGGQDSDIHQGRLSPQA